MLKNVRSMALDVVLFGVLATGALVLASCRKPVRPTMHLNMVPHFVQFFGPAGLNWKNWYLYEYQDDQPLNDGAGDYGPEAKIFANTALDTMQMTHFDNDSGVVVAVVFVDTVGTDPLPQTYTRLGLDRDMTCVIMKYRSAAWQVFTSKSSSAGRLCPNQAAQMTQLSVINRYTAYANSSDYPPVARFELLDLNRTGFGVKCQAGWCSIGVAGDVLLASAQNGNNPSPTKQSLIAGWFDDQDLAVDDGFFRPKLKPKMRSSIIPNDTIATWTVADYNVAHGRQVARIFIKGQIAKGYKERGLHSGWNDLWMRYDGTEWRAHFNQEPSEWTDWMEVDRTDHRLNGVTWVPPTARWAWLYLDEEIWIECDVGCCRVLAAAD